MQQKKTPQKLMWNVCLGGACHCVWGGGGGERERREGGGERGGVK